MSISVLPENVRKQGVCRDGQSSSVFLPRIARAAHRFRGNTDRMTPSVVIEVITRLDAYCSLPFSFFFYPFLFFYFRRNAAKDSFTIGGVAKRSPGGRCPCTRLYEEVSRENVRSECGGKGGFPCTHVRTSRLHPPHGFPVSPSLSVCLSRAFSFSSLSTPFRLVVRQISRSYGNTMVDDAESGGGC